MSVFPITSKGYAKLEEEIKFLKTVARPKVVQAIAQAREFGDLSENAEYHEARKQQSFIEGRIIDLEDKVARAQVIDVAKLSGQKVMFGATVMLADCNTDEEVSYMIVGEYEADITKKLISVASPLARAVIGKTSGDIVEVSSPKGKKQYEILQVGYVDYNI